MTKKELDALKKAGLTIRKIRYKYDIYPYDGLTKVFLSFGFLLKFDIKLWPNLKTYDEIYHNTASNTSALVFFGKDVGMRLDSNGDKISVILSHPMAKFWLSILQPIWDEQNIGKCKTCHGSGWDGIGYTLTCIDCGGTGKI